MQLLETIHYIVIQSLKHFERLKTSPGTFWAFIFWLIQAGKMVALLFWNNFFIENGFFEPKSLVYSVPARDFREKMALESLKIFK